MISKATSEHYLILRNLYDLISRRVAVDRVVLIQVSLLAVFGFRERSTLKVVEEDG